MNPNDNQGRGLMREATASDFFIAILAVLCCWLVGSVLAVAFR